MKIPKLIPVLIVFGLLLSTAGSLPRPDYSTKVQPRLLAAAALNPGQTVRIIAGKSSISQDAEGLVTRLGGRVIHDLNVIEAFAAEMPAAAAVILAQSDTVHWVSLDAPVIGQSENYGSPAPKTIVPTDNFFLDSMRVRQVWDMGLTGAGIGVAIVDSGVSIDPDFNSKLKVYKFATNSRSVTDVYGHGTHVAGIVAGNGTASAGKYMGIAPDATLYAVKVADGNGMAFESDVVAGLQWVYDHRAAYNIRVVNLSFNTTVEQSYHVSPLDAAVEILWFNGVVVVASAGNADPHSTVQLYNASPANDPFIITVGAADEMGTAVTGDDVLSIYTSLGVTDDGSLKPNLVAPGSNIYSVLSKHSAWAKQFPERVTADREYIRLSGTSMSAPMVTGAVALLLQDEPNLTPDQVKYRLMNAASRSLCRNIGQNNYCIPFMDVYAAVTGTTTASANTGTLPSQLLYSGTEPVLWTSVGWNSVGWNSVGWNSVGWNSVGWNSVGWNSIYWGE